MFGSLFSPGNATLAQRGLPLLRLTRRARSLPPSLPTIPDAVARGPRLCTARAGCVLLLLLLLLLLLRPLLVVAVIFLLILHFDFVDIHPDPHALALALATPPALRTRANGHFQPARITRTKLPRQASFQHSTGPLPLVQCPLRAGPCLSGPGFVVHRLPRNPPVSACALDSSNKKQLTTLLALRQSSRIRSPGKQEQQRRLQGQWANFSICNNCLWSSASTHALRRPAITRTVLRHVARRRVALGQPNFASKKTAVLLSRRVCRPHRQGQFYDSGRQAGTC